jgi:putative SOS response-associated peptidase YedK
VCGRFVSTSPPSVLAAYFDAATIDEAVAASAPNTNTAPGTGVSVLRVDGGGRRLERFRWGLVPSWAKDPSIGNRMINARSETAQTKPSFRRAAASRRCIVPADGFYEWFRVPGARTRQPYLIHRPDDEPFAFAGLWEQWRPPTVEGAEPLDSDEVLRTVTVLTTSANDAMGAIHDRMPVLLAPADWDEWLALERLADGRFEELCVPAPDSLTVLRPVSTEVNDARHKGEHLLDPVEPVDGAPPGTDGASPVGD